MKEIFYKKLNLPINCKLYKFNDSIVDGLVAEQIIANHWALLKQGSEFVKPYWLHDHSVFILCILVADTILQSPISAMDLVQFGRFP